MTCNGNITICEHERTRGNVCYDARAGHTAVAHGTRLRGAARLLRTAAHTEDRTLRAARSQRRAGRGPRCRCQGRGWPVAGERRGSPRPPPRGEGRRRPCKARRTTGTGLPGRPKRARRDHAIYPNRQMNIISLPTRGQICVYGLSSSLYTCLYMYGHTCLYMYGHTCTHRRVACWRAWGYTPTRCLLACVRGAQVSIDK